MKFKKENVQFCEAHDHVTRDYQSTVHAVLFSSLEKVFLQKIKSNFSSVFQLFLTLLKSVLQALF